MAYWLDDGFDSWPQVVRAGNAAAGLYVRCGAWISRSIRAGTTTEPVVPTDVAAMYGTPEWITKLVVVGLWRTEEAGYRDEFFHRAPTGDRLNPTPEELARKKKKKSESNARYYEANKPTAKTRPKTVLRRSEEQSADPSQDSPPSHSPTGRRAARSRAPAPTTHLASCPSPGRDPATCPTCNGERKAAGAA